MNSENPAAIVGSEYCVPYETVLFGAWQTKFFGSDKYVLSDDENNMMFNFKELAFSTRKLIFNTAGNPIITLHSKMFSGPRSWQAYKGESIESKDLIFTTKGSNRKNVEFKVYMANNHSKDVPDFQVKGSLSKKSMAIYAGESSIVVAQVQFKVKVPAFTRKKTVVTVNPNVDCAFVTAIVVLLEALQRSRAAGGGASATASASAAASASASATMGTF